MWCLAHAARACRMRNGLFTSRSVSQVRALPEEWWEKQRDADPRTEYRLTPEEVAENKRLEAERVRLHAEKRAIVQKDRQAVVARTQFLLRLEHAKQDKV